MKSETKAVWLRVRLTKAQLDALQREAQRLDRTVSDVVRIKLFTKNRKGQHSHG